MEKSLFSEFDYWYKFLAISGIIIVVSTPLQWVGFCFFFIGLGVWATQNSIIWKGKETGGRDNFYSCLFKIIAIIIFVVSNLQYIKNIYGSIFNQ